MFNCVADIINDLRRLATEVEHEDTPACSSERYALRVLVSDLSKILHQSICLYHEKVADSILDERIRVSSLHDDLDRRNRAMESAFKILKEVMPEADQAALQQFRATVSPAKSSDWDKTPEKQIMRASASGPDLQGPLFTPPPKPDEVHVSDLFSPHPPRTSGGCMRMHVCMPVHKVR